MLPKRPNLAHPSLADVPAEARRAVEALAVATDVATEAAASRYAAASLAARLLIDAGLTLRHAAEILGVSYERVNQWAKIGQVNS
jgi:hypothetical protein